MAKFTQHIPAFIDHEDSDLLRFKFHSFNGLRRKLNKLLPNSVSDSEELCRGDSGAVMTVTKPSCEGYEYYVIGLVEGFDLSKTLLKSYDDPYYTECKMPKIFSKDNKDIEILLENGKEVSIKLEIEPPDMEFLFSVDDSLLSHRQLSQVVWKSFCVAYQHFHYVGYQEDLYYMVALIQKYLDNCSEFKTDFGFTRYDEQLFSEFILKKDPEKYSEISKKVDEYYKCYIDTVTPQLYGIKNSHNGRFDCGNFDFYFKIGLFVRLYLEDFFGVHKDLPDFSKITLLPPTPDLMYF